MQTHGPEPTGFSPADRQLLLDLARRSLAERAAGHTMVLNSAEFHARLKERKGCFVTLFKHGELRGCIGHVLPQMPLFEAVSHNACSAGFRDPRFEPVSAAEIDEIRIEISILSDLTPLEPGDPDHILAQLRPNIDGVLLKRGGQMSTFLPQVWEAVPRKEEFLSKLSQKAGWDPDAWKGPEVLISVYQVAAFSEPETDRAR